MRQILIFPNGFQQNVSSIPITQDVNSVYNARWISNNEIAEKEWVIHAKIHQIIDDEDITMIYLEELYISRNYRSLI